MSKEAMKLALEALEYIEHNYMSLPAPAEKAITALREALAKPDFWEVYVSEPVKAATTETNGGRTGWPPGLLQDDCKGLSKWLSNKPDAKRRVREALDKMAENARELGLDYEPLAGTQVSKVWWDGEKLMAKPIPLEDFYEPAQQEPVDILIEAWQYLDETHGHLLDTGDVEGRMHISVIRSAWKQMDSLVQQIWDERGQPNEQEPFGFAVMENPIAPPAQRTWVGLTDEERDTLIKEFNGLAVSFYKAIEAKLRSKNEDRN